jgi:hypothetical protein
MALKHYNPTSPGRRALVLVDRSELHKGRPEKSLTEGLTKSGGRGQGGRVAVRFRGGGAKTLYRKIDFKRRKWDMVGTVERLEYDPNRTAFIALVTYADGEKTYIIAPQRLKAGDTIIAGEKNPFLVLDVGANPQPKPLHLAQYALMGAAYYRGTFGVDQPKVGMLNIGSEELKGTPLVKEARQILKQMPIAFHGNVEGVEVFTGDCHVVVSDGFTGNVMLKVSEGCAEYVMRTMLGAMKQVGVEKEKIQGVLAAIMPRIDYSEYGGALLLGVDGVVTICHGRSQAPAFCNAIRFARKALTAQVNQHIVEAARAFAAQSPEATH